MTPSSCEDGGAIVYERLLDSVRLTAAVYEADGPLRVAKSRSPWRAGVARLAQLPRRFVVAAAGGPAVSRLVDDQWRVSVAAVIGP